MTESTRSDWLYIYTFSMAAKHLLEADDIDGDVDYTDIVKDLLDQIANKASAYTANA